MADAIAVLNAGSSSIKFSLFVALDGDLELVARGQAEGLFTSPRFVAKDSAGKVLSEKAWGEGAQLGHAGALDHLVGVLRTGLGTNRVLGVGHRVVHGGAQFTGPTIVTPQVLEELRELVPLAPLHQPHNLAAIRRGQRAAAGRAAGGVLRYQLSIAASRPSPSWCRCQAEIRRGGVQRYGFHGLSYEYIASVLPLHDAQAARGKVVVVLHLGNGASMCAIMERAKRGEHDGVHRSRRPADGNALRQPRSRRDAVPDGRAWHGCAPSRS